MMVSPELSPGPGDALLIIDVQNDFLPGGRLAVPEGNAVIAPLNRWIARFVKAARPIYASRDWHAADHCSFSDQGGPWPEHCVAGTDGAAFAAELALPDSVILVSKAVRPEIEAYSGFAGTGLAEQLRVQKISRLYVGGLATDYCVLNTVKDALTHGFRVLLIEEAVRAVNVAPGDGEKALAEMRRCGAVLI